jgi:hypothetical protein
LDKYSGGGKMRKKNSLAAGSGNRIFAAKISIRVLGLNTYDLP